MKMTVKKNTLYYGFLEDLRQCLNFLLKLEETKEHMQAVFSGPLGETTYHLSNPRYRRFFQITPWHGATHTPNALRTEEFGILRNFCSLPNDADIAMDAEEWQSLCDTQIWYKENVK